MTRQPTFFIVGAPKCGTTAMSEYLRSHPRIFICQPKEPHFFATDFHPYRRDMIRSEEEYLALFSDAGPAHQALGEASVWYLYSSTALPLIRERIPQAKILVMLRNPVDYLHSLHGQLRYNFDEDVPDFEEAWRLQAVRAQGRRLPPRCRTPFLLQYRELARFDRQVQRLLDAFPKPQVKLVVFEEFVRAPRRTYLDVLAFLDVPDDGRTVFPRVNRNKRLRYRWLAFADQRPPRFVQSTIRLVKRGLGRSGSGLLSRLYTEESERASLSREFRDELNALFRQDVERLSKIAGRSFDLWLH